MIRTLRVARTSAVKARAVALRWSTIKTAPDGLREQLRGLDMALLDACTALDLPADPARRCRRSPSGRHDPGCCLTPPQPPGAPWPAWPGASPSWTTRSPPSCSPSSPRPHRPCSPVRRRARRRRPAAGHRRRQPRPAHQRGRLRPPVRRRTHPRLIRRTQRHRLNRGGDRHANHALWRIAMTPALRPTHPRLPRPPRRPTAVQQRHPALPQALHRPRGPPRHPHRPHPNPALTSIARRARPPAGLRCCKSQQQGGIRAHTGWVRLGADRDRHRCGGRRRGRLRVAGGARVPRRPAGRWSG